MNMFACTSLDEQNTSFSEFRSKSIRHTFRQVYYFCTWSSTISFFKTSTTNNLNSFKLFYQSPALSNVAYAICDLLYSSSLFDLIFHEEPVTGVKV